MRLFTPIWKLPKGQRMPDGVMMLALGFFVGLAVAAMAAGAIASSIEFDRAGKPAAAEVERGKLYALAGASFATLAALMAVGAFREQARRDRLNDRDR